MWLFTELKRRNVFRVAVAYVVASWLLIQVAETIFPLFGFDEGPARVVVIILVIGFPLLLIFSWLYELTPEGLKLERDIDRSSSLVHHTGKKLDRAIIIVLALALGYFAFDKFVLDPARDIEREETVAKRTRSEMLVESFGTVSIAVLPFLNMSGDADNEYFSDGISEELLNLLAKIPKLRVISRSSSFSFKGKDVDMRDLAEQLEVTHVLEGSVRKAGDQVRITVQLIEALSDSHLWSETYDREFTDIFAVQDEISAAVVAELNNRLGLEAKVVPREIATTSSEAHEAYMRGRFLIVQRTRVGFEGAIQEFENALVHDPDYALAHAELAIAIFLGTPYLNLTDPEALRRGTPHVERAMALDPTLAEAHAAAGYLSWFKWDLEETLRHYERAIELNPNYSIVYVWKGSLLENYFGRYKESIAMYVKARQLDPTSLPVISNYFYNLLETNKLAEADHELEKIASIAPGTYARLKGYRSSIGGQWANNVLGQLDRRLLEPAQGQRSRYFADWLAVLGLENEALAVVELPNSSTLSFLGKSSEWEAGAAAVLDHNPEGTAGPYNTGMVLAGAGNYTLAGPSLEAAWQRNRRRVNPLFDISGATALIAIRRSTGEDYRADALLAAIRDDVRRQRDAGMSDWCIPKQCADYSEGIAAFLSGEREKGLALIARAVDNGYLIFPNEVYLQDLYDDPDFAPIMAVQQARQMRERDKFLAIVCSDNPYAAVWQPEDGTCERFAAESRN